MDDTSRRAPRFRRFGKFSAQKIGLRDDDEDEDDTPAFLPMAREKEQALRPRPGEELSGTLRQDAERAAAARFADRSAPADAVSTDSPTSSISSGAAVHQVQTNSRRTDKLSPHRAGPPPRLSPRKSDASGREASDGTPSMGSSFSDLDGKLSDHDARL